jgi:hypothetical protein
VNDALDQLRGEAIHLAFLAFTGGIAAVSGVIAWFIRRDLKLAEVTRTEQGLRYTALEERFADHVRRTGMELVDVKYRMGIMATQIKREIPEVSIPEWPSR